MKVFGGSWRSVRRGLARVLAGALVGAAMVAVTPTAASADPTGYEIVNTASGECLDGTGWYVTVAPCDGRLAQRWGNSWGTQSYTNAETGHRWCLFRGIGARTELRDCIESTNAPDFLGRWWRPTEFPELSLRIITRATVPNAVRDCLTKWGTDAAILPCVGTAEQNWIYRGP
ncbi:hypothetical protein EDD29_4851 [Actinocorallia herbida]|uniref:Ricin-type beta-trefoil lectin protein n=1 Tax=Actinocorallia herbida TaxID=58109 RepID=A0A3N1D169_9ACTN|nr:hypothetical protein [Actinocorallia herbida]ROO87256.1 hypothetical protein EDD29_4851 [Actinocorallia herbida]